MIVKKSDGYHIYSHDGEKHLGGPYTKEKAKLRLKTIEYFKHIKEENQMANGYIAFYKGKQIEIEASSSLEAQKKAAEKFKAKKSYEVTVKLAEKDGKQVTTHCESIELDEESKDQEKWEEAMKQAEKKLGSKPNKATKKDDLVAYNKFYATATTIYKGLMKKSNVSECLRKLTEKCDGKCNGKCKCKEDGKGCGNPNCKCKNKQI